MALRQLVTSATGQDAPAVVLVRSWLLGGALLTVGALAALVVCAAGALDAGVDGVRGRPALTP